MTEATMPKDKDQAIREAIREEEDAINTYDQLIKFIPEHAEVFTEIKNDERDHLDKLLALADKVDPDKHVSQDSAETTKEEEEEEEIALLNPNITSALGDLKEY